MGRKSRHGHNKYRKATLNRKEGQRTATLTIQRPDDTLGPVTTPVINKPKHEAGITVTTRITDKEKYAYIINELQLVGIVTAVVLVILIITALVLR
jgi:hypothetical protein